MNLKETYLFRLFRADKILFGLLLAYALGIACFALRQREEFPFLLYGMYSLKEQPKDTYTSYSITLAGQEVRYAKLRDSQKEMVTSSMQHFIELLEAGKVDSATALKFEKWLMNYCMDMRMTGENVMNVYRLTCKYNSNGRPDIIKKDLVYSYAAQ